MQTSAESKAETVVGIAAVLTGGGALTFALFPLALPMIVLLGILAVPLIPLAILGAIAYAIARPVLRRRSSRSSDAPIGSDVRRRSGSAAVRFSAVPR